MKNAEVWARFMAGALSGADIADAGKHSAEIVRRAACLADYAFGEYQRRIVGMDEDGPLLEPVYQLQSEGSGEVK